MTNCTDRYMLFFDNCAAFREAFRFSDRFPYSLAAARLASDDIAVTAEELENLHSEMKENFRFFSPLRDIQPAVIALMVEKGSTEAVLGPLKAAYEAMREHFAASEYVALASLMLSVTVKEDELAAKAAHVRAIYDAFRSEHRWATSHSEVLVCAILAIRGTEPDTAAADAQACYEEMRRSHRFRCAWSLAAKMTIDPHEPEKKCADVAGIRRRLKKERRALTLYYALASLVSCPDAALWNADEALALFDTLRNEKGFGSLSMDSEERLLLAYMLIEPTDELFILALSGYYEKRAAIAAAAAAT